MARQIVLGNDVQAQYAELKAELDAAITRVIASGQLVMGEENTHFEEAFAAYCHAPHALGVANGTDALHLALHGLGVGPGDEVIVPAVTFVATASAVVRTGARPVFVDVDPATTNVDPAAVAAAVTDRTAAVVPVHLFGLTADMDPINDVAARHGLVVVEDAAQGVGARYWDRPAGSLGDAAAFSFFPTKNLGCFGDGGAVVTSRSDLRDTVARTREHGFEGDGFVAVEIGLNSRLDAIQAAVLTVKLRTLEADVAARIEVAARYDRLLAGTAITPPAVPFGHTHAFHQYTVSLPSGRERRDELLAYLRRNGVDARTFYTTLVPEHPAFAHLGHRPGEFPVAEAYAANALSLPCHPRLRSDQQEYVCTLVKGSY